MTDEEFKTFLRDFYVELAAKQQPLDEELERVWWENVDELYGEGEEGEE